MLFLQFATRSEATTAHALFQNKVDEGLARVHWANVNLSVNTLPFLYTAKKRVDRIDLVKKLLIDQLKFLDVVNLQSYIINKGSTASSSSPSSSESLPTEVFSPQSLDYRLSMDDIFIPFDAGKYQDYGYIMFPHAENTNDTMVLLLLFLLHSASN